MICYGKNLLSMENIRRASSTGYSKFKKLYINRAFISSKVCDARYIVDNGKWFTPCEAERMSRRELQKWCKKLHIRANTKTAKMRADLLEFHENVLSNSEILRHPFFPIQNPQTVTSHARQDKLLFSNNLPVELGQIRHFKNTPSVMDDCLYEDAAFYCEGPESNRFSSEKQLPSVSKILKSTAPKSKIFAISHWTKKQKELLGEVGFRLKMNEIRKKGLDFHNFIHRCLIDGHLNRKIPERLHGYLASTRKVFDELGDAIASEKYVQHAHLNYHGKLDTLACYRGYPCIIEWKTSQQRKPSLAECGEYPVQMVAYAGAVNSDPSSGLQIRNGLLVIAYEDGSPADVHFFHLKQCRGFWQDWLIRLHQFKNQ